MQTSRTLTLLITVFSLLSLALAVALPHDSHGEGNTDPHGNDNSKVNRTFTLTTVSNQNTTPYLLYRPVYYTPPEGSGSAVVYSSNATIPCNTTVPLKVYIYNGDLYRKCNTSPTGGCLGFLTKAYGGALTGWYFQFSEDEQPRNWGPGSGPIRGGFKVETDPEDASRKILYNGSGSALWTLCGYPADGTYAINSSPVPPYAVNGPYCTQSGFKFKVHYTG
ncbi:hypothetical protein DFH27DRAFT_524930 [Peziza echinospora]|nr:hypothetical protein DFH27DRAFT_524930 [Peziza echinospora]